MIREQEGHPHPPSVVCFSKTRSSEASGCFRQRLVKNWKSGLDIWTFGGNGGGGQHTPVLRLQGDVVAAVQNSIPNARLARLHRADADESARGMQDDGQLGIAPHEVGAGPLRRSGHFHRMEAGQDLLPQDA